MNSLKIVFVAALLASFVGCGADDGGVVYDDCEPGALRCSGMKVENCSQNREWIFSVDCSTTGQTCLEGVCYGGNGDGNSDGDIQGPDDRTCVVDDDCVSETGRNTVCQNGLCRAPCLLDSHCAYWGWDVQCNINLSESMTQEDNFFEDNPAEGICTINADGITWGDNQDETANTAKLQGVYGEIQVLSKRLCGISEVGCLDVAEVTKRLVKIQQMEDGVAATPTVCSVESIPLKLSGDNSSRNEAFDGTYWWQIEEIFAPSLNPYPIRAEILPIEDIAIGFDMATTMVPELRGVTRDYLLPLSDDGLPLPTSEKPDEAWDQDRDGSPGMTIKVRGVLEGYVYFVERIWMAYNLKVAALDADGNVDMLWGLISHSPELSIVDVSDVAAHPNSKRSYTRMVRVPDDATCLDVLDWWNDERCGSDPNQVEVDPERDGTWLCYSPLIDPQGLAF